MLAIAKKKKRNLDVNQFSSRSFNGTKSTRTHSIILHLLVMSHFLFVPKAITVCYRPFTHTDAVTGVTRTNVGYAKWVA